MADTFTVKRIAEVVDVGTPTATDYLLFDNGSGMFKAEAGAAADAVRPVASEGEATAGSDNTKVMTALRVSQYVVAQVGVTIASKEQGDLANTAVQPDDLGTAAAADADDFATAAQGTLADSAVQPGDLGDLATEDTVTSALLNSDVFSTAHSWSGVQTFTNPVVGTQMPGDNSTKAASTAFVQSAVAAAGGGDLLSTNNLSDLTDPVSALNNLGLIDLSMVPVASGVMASEVADFANGFYWLNGRQYPSLLSWLQAGDSSFKRDGGARRLDKNGRLAEVGTDIPRLAYDAAGNPSGVLIEGTITNRALYSQDLTNVAWVKGNATVTSTTAVQAPDGSLTAFKLTENSATGLHYTSQLITVPADTRCTVSICVQAATRTKGRLWFVNTNGCYVNFDLTAGTVGTATAYGTGTAVGAYIVQCPPPYDDWYRIVLMGKLGSGQTSGYLEIDLNDASGNDSYTGNGSSYFYIAQPQLEAVGVATTYTPTTRNKDLLTRFLVEQPTEWTKIFKARTAKFAPAAYQVLWHDDDGTEANDFEAWRDSSNHLQVEVHYNGTDQGTIDMGVVDNDTDLVLAVRGTATEMAASLNGGAVIKKAVTMPSTMTVERYGTNVAPEAREWSSTIAYQATIPVAASDSELQALSS